MNTWNMLVVLRALKLPYNDNVEGPRWMLAETYRLVLSSNILKNKGERVALMRYIVFCICVNIGLSQIR